MLTACYSNPSSLPIWTNGSLDPTLSALYAAWQKGNVKYLSMNPGPFGPMINAYGEVQVYIKGVGGALPSSTALSAIGAMGIQQVPLMGLVQAWVPISQLMTLIYINNVGKVTVPDVFGFEYHDWHRIPESR